MRPLSLALLLLAASAVSAQGRLAFETDRHDFGRVEEGGVPSVTFRFTNAGDAPLRLESVEAACGCTTPSYPHEAVAPGETGEIAVAYDSNGRPGPFEKAVYVVAGEAGAATLRISGVVEPALIRTGTRIGALAFNRVLADMGEVPAGEAAQTSFQFANAGTRPVRIERVEAPEGVEVAFPDRPVFSDDVRGLFVSVEDPSALADADGAFAFAITLHTTDAEVPVKEVRVVGHIGAARVLPEGGR